MEKDFEIEREYFREEIEKLRQASMISSKANTLLNTSKVDETRQSSSVATEISLHLQINGRCSKPLRYKRTTLISVL